MSRSPKPPRTADGAPLSSLATPVRRGLMFVLSSPSGAGKTTISRRLLAHDPQIRMSVSVTTRAIRAGEVAGKDYFFTSREAFDEMVAKEHFLEWAEVFGNRYGTPRAEIEAGLASGQDYLFDIDWQGAQQLYQRARADIVRVFLLPPSIEELRRRLAARGTDSAEVVDGRMARARDEISHWDGYDYVLVNDDVDRCFANVCDILAAERLKRERQTGLWALTRELLAP